MKFPKTGDIATQDVVCTDIKATFAETMHMMLANEHRNIVVVDEKEFYLLGLVDILNIKANNIDVDTPLYDLELRKIPKINRDKNILDCVEYLSNNVEYICVVNNDNSLFGLITHTDITSNIDPDTLMDNYRLQDYLKLGRRMKKVEKDEKISNLINDMVKSTYDNVVIVEDDIPLGIFTIRDAMRLIKGSIDLDEEVELHMSSPLESINKNSTIREAISFIKEKHFKRVVVVDDDGKLFGILSQKELITISYSKWTILMKEHQNELNEINEILKNKNKEYEYMASTDALTGLYNRHKFTELYHSTYKAMVQQDSYLSLILLDIDDFKSVNDLYGHTIGDKTLIQISHVLLKTLRNIDIVSRWGGEEFLIFIPAANLKNTIAIAQKIRVAIEELEIDVVGKVTASLGVSQVIDGESMEKSIDRADKALYLAKSSGKNCVKS